MTFGEIIRYARETRNLSQEVLTEILKKEYHVGISRSYISMLETNTRSNPTAKLVIALLHYFDLPMSATTSLYSAADQQDEPAYKQNAASYSTGAAREKQLPRANSQLAKTDQTSALVTSQSAYRTKKKTAAAAANFKS